jgi:hypothetical protein
VIYLLSHRKTSKIATSRKVTNSVVLSTLNQIDENTTFKTNETFLLVFSFKVLKTTFFWPENIFVRNCYILREITKINKKLLLFELKIFFFFYFVVFQPKPRVPNKSGHLYQKEKQLV